jgi:hypothetical protein
MLATALAAQDFTVWVSEFSSAFDTQDNTQVLNGFNRAKAVFMKQNLCVTIKYINSY